MKQGCFEVLTRGTPFCVLATSHVPHKQYVNFKLACKVKNIVYVGCVGTQCPVDIGSARTEVKRRPATTELERSENEVVMACRTNRKGGNGNEESS